MDSKQFEKIEALEAIALLEKGEVVYMEGGTKFRLDGNFELEGQSVEQYSFVPVELSLGWILKQNWYKPRPFDVRQAMRERPGEWVGKFKSDEGHWMAVGFDTKHFNALTRYLNQHVPVETEIPGTGFPSPEDLDACIPIDEVTK